MKTTTKAGTSVSKNLSRRWQLVSRRTGTPVRSYRTRALARSRKTASQRIFDARNGAFVR